MHCCSMMASCEEVASGVRRPANRKRVSPKDASTAFISKGAGGLQSAGASGIQFVGPAARELEDAESCSFCYRSEKG